MEHRNDLEIVIEQIKHFLLTSLGFWYLYVIAFALAFGFAKFKNRYSKNIYSIYTTIYIESRYAQPEIYAGGIPITPSINLENEIGKLTSYQMNYKVLEQLPEFEFQYYLDRKMAYDLELYKKSPIKITFSPQSDPLYNTKIFITILDNNSLSISIGKHKKEYKIRFGQAFTLGNISFMITKTKHFTSGSIGKKYYIIHKNIKDLAHYYSQNLRIDLRSPNSTILWIWMETSTPYKDIDYLNRLAQEYINQRVSKKNEMAIKTIEFIDRQLSVFQDSLKVAERQMTKFKKSNIINISDQGEQLNQQLQELETQIKTLQLKKAYYNNLLSILQQSNNQNIILPPPEGLGISDEALQSLLNKLTQAIEEKKQATLVVKDEQRLPLTQQINLRIQSLKNTIYKYLIQSIDFTNKNIQDLEKERQKLYTQLLKFPVAEREYLQINRKFEINNKIYTFLMQRRMEAGITLASSRPDAEIIDKALPQTIRFKRRVEYISTVKAVVIAIVIVLLVITLIFILDNKIKSRADIERLTDIPIVGNIVENKTGISIPVTRYPRSSITEAFRSLRTNILYYMVDTPAQVILLTSTVSGEGKTFVSANLAAIFAGTGKKTVILEADLRKPRVQDLFETNHENGIVTYLIGEHSYQEIIHKTDIENLYLIPCGEIPPNPVELIESKKMKELFDRLRQDFEFIIVDSPPVGIVTDALVLANYADIMLFVIRQLYSTRQSIRLLDELKERKKLDRIAIIINGIKTNMLYGLKYGYGYNYGYGYGISYGYGYYEEEKQEPTTFLGKLGKKITQLLYKLFK